MTWQGGPELLNSQALLHLLSYPSFPLISCHRSFNLSLPIPGSLSFVKTIPTLNVPPLSLSFHNLSIFMRTAEMLGAKHAGYSCPSESLPDVITGILGSPPVSKSSSKFSASKTESENVFYWHTENTES